MKKKTPKISPALISTPYDVHDAYDNKVKKAPMNPLGGAAENTEAPRKVSRSGSFGYFASDLTRESQERQACCQAALAALFLFVFIGSIVYFIYHVFFRDVEGGKFAVFFYYFYFPLTPPAALTIPL